jgi:hypothetical protein
MRLLTYLVRDRRTAIRTQTLARTFECPAQNPALWRTADHLGSGDSFAEASYSASWASKRICGTSGPRRGTGPQRIRAGVLCFTSCPRSWLSYYSCTNLDHSRSRSSRVGWGRQIDRRGPPCAYRREPGCCCETSSRVGPLPKRVTC